MFDWKAQSALVSYDDERDAEGGQVRVFSNGRVRLKACSGDGAVKIHCQVHRDARVDHRVCNALGITLPLLPDQPADSELPIFWLSPNEWLIVAPLDDQARLRRELVSLACGKMVAITDLSAHLEIIELSGEMATALLSEGCGVDMHSKRFNKGNYFRSQLFDVDVLVHKITAKPVYLLYVDRSLALYLWQCLEGGANTAGPVASKRSHSRGRADITADA